MLIIDPGNSYYKITDGQRETIYPAVIGAAQDVWTEEPLLQVEQHYIGKTALDYCRFQEYTLDESKSAQRTLLILTKYALTQYPEESQIVFLLPYSNFFEEKKRIVEMFVKPTAISYQLGDEKHQLDFKPSLVTALPQTYCAAMDYLLDDDATPKDKKQAAQNILVIGVGFLNTHYIFLKNGNVVRDLSFSSLNGMHLIYKAFSDATGRNVYQIDSWDGINALKPLHQALAGVIQTDIETHYRRKDIGLFLFVEGGAEAVYNLMPYDNKAIHPGQFSNVRGGLKVAMKLWHIGASGETTK